MSASRATRRLGRSIWRSWSGYHRRRRIEAKTRCLKLLGPSASWLAPSSVRPPNSTSAPPSSTASPASARRRRSASHHSNGGQRELSLRLICAAEPAWALDHMKLDADGGGESFVRRSDHLWGWLGVPAAWMYALPLTALTDVTLRAQVIAPAVALLQHDADPTDAFPANSVAFRVPEGVPSA